MLPDFRVDRKEQPQRVEIGVRGSEFFVVGDLDNATNIITSAQIEHRPGNLTPIKEIGVQGNIESGETVWSVDSENDFWQIHLTGYDKNSATCDNVDVRRNDGTQWNYTLTNGEGPKYPSTNLVFSRAQGYMAPIFCPNENGIEMNGKRLIAVEPLNSADYVGVVEPGFRVSKEKGIEIITQPAKHTSPDLTAVPTIRAVRASVHKPDYDKLKPIPGVITYRLGEVDLDPDQIASAPSGQKMRVVNIGLEYGSDVELPSGQSATPLKEYANVSADGVGFAGFYQLFTDKFRDHLGVHEEGANRETANYQHDPKESYGKPIRVALIEVNNTWRVVYENDPHGKFDRNGNPIPAKVARNFDPTSIVDANGAQIEPVQIHKLKPVNKNNARETGTRTLDGLHPVEVYIYKKSEDTKKLTSETLCDFKESGDGPAQMALFEWEVHTYSDVFNRVAIEELGR